MTDPNPVIAEILAEPIPDDPSLVSPGGVLRIHGIERFYYVSMGALLAGADPAEAARLATKFDHWFHRRNSKFDWINWMRKRLGARNG